MFRRFRLIFVTSLAVAGLAGGAATGSTGDEKRRAIPEMRDEVLTELYAEKPTVRDQVAAAPGYAVFSNANVNLVLDGSLN